MNNFTFANPTKILFGKGQVENTGKETAAIGKRVLLLSGGASSRKSGLIGNISRQLQGSGVHFVEQSGVSPNPEIGEVRKGANTCKSEKLDAVLAVGGGSVVDAAKAIAAGACYGGDPWDFFGKKTSPENALPIGVVLTLSATGSEANGNSVVSNAATNEKRPMYSPLYYPKFSILDPELTYTVPKDQTAYGSIDILSHVYEQYFHRAQNSPIQDGLAETLMRTVIENAPIAIENPADYDARANLMWASTMALNGILSCGTGGDWSSHMIGHELSANYGIAHGAALAVIFPAWMKHVHTANPRRFRRFAGKVWMINTAGMNDAQAADAAIGAMEDFYTNKLKTSVRMKDYGIDGAKLELMTASAVKFRQLGVFKPLTREDILEIYRLAM
ncbi:MAG: iron-containing alcohol dehydrogenase [Nitrospinae bacterium]|nr:iron-containing alcohol dehydrogenase [Nitrospinota bacterium]